MTNNIVTLTIEDAARLAGIEPAAVLADLQLGDLRDLSPQSVNGWARGIRAARIIAG